MIKLWQYKRVWLFFLIFIGIRFYAHSQVSTGSILGAVTDPSGAVIVGASVKVINARTNVSRTVSTNSSGLFNAANLVTGTYDVVVTSTGFSAEKVAGVTLDVGAQRELNIQLKIGLQDVQVVVTSAASSVDLVSSTTMPVVDDHEIVQLPLNGRDWASLASLQPGVAPVRTQSPLSISNQRANRGVGNQLAIDGARPQMNNYRLDGISINDYSNGGPGGVVGTNLGVDAIQEFSVVTGNATADYGKTAGGIVNAVTRSGGNKVHGDVYEFFRNSALDARNEFDSPGIIAPLRRNQFGASVGGPIIKDRTFLFGNYEGLRWFNSTNAASVVPSPDARNGFLCSNPCTSHTTVPVSSSVAPYLALFPLPNDPALPAGSAVGPTGNSDTGTFLFGDPLNTVENYAALRGDHNFNGKDHISVYYLYDLGSYTAPDALNFKVKVNVLHRQAVSLSDTHTFTQNVLNTLHLGFSRVYSDAPTTLNAVNAAAGNTSLGFVPSLPVGLITVGSGVTGFVGGLHGVGEYVFHYNSFQVYDDAYWTHGKHSIKAGFAFERLQNNQLGTSNPNGQWTFGSLSGFLQNQPTAFNAPLGQTTSPKDLRQSVTAGYITDDYRAAHNLTLNLGVRYEVASVPSETAGRLSNLPTLTAAAPNLGSPYFSNPTLKDVAPRIGLAYAPFGNGKTAIHAGYGIYDSLPLDYLFEGLTILSAPFYQSGSVSSGLTGLFPTGGFGLLTPATFRYAYTPQHPQRAYLQQYTLNVQHELPGDMIATLGYSGSHGTHLPYREDDINTVQPVAELPGGFYAFPALYSTTSYAKITNSRLNPNVGQISAMIPEGFLIYNAMQASMLKRLSHHYQYQVSYTWQKGIDDGSSSTFGDTFFNSVSSLPYFARDRRIAVSDYNIQNNIIFNYLILLPDAPRKWGEAGWFLNGWQQGSIFQASTGLPITPQISGDPLGLNSSDTFDFPNRNYNCNPINKLGYSVNPGRSYLKTSCFSYPLATAGYNPILGNSGRNSIMGPGYQDFDFSLIKNTMVPRLGETFNVQFRAELFNLFNRVNYSNPVKAQTQIFGQAAAPTAANPTPQPGPAGSAGALTTAGSSRQTQVALKIIF